MLPTKEIGDVCTQAKVNADARRCSYFELGLLVVLSVRCDVYGKNGKTKTQSMRLKAKGKKSALQMGKDTNGRYASV